MLRSHKVWWYDEGVSQRSSLMVMHMCWCRGELRFLNLSWFSAFDFIKIIKMLVIGNLLKYVCAKSYQNRAWSGKVIAVILLAWYIVILL